MARKIFSSVSILLATALLAASGCAPALAQTNEAPAGGPYAQRRCTTVALTSESPMLPVRLIEPYLQRRVDLQASKLVLTGEQASADAVVNLTQSGERDTHIEVSNRITGRHASTISLWTDYPGMIASAVMEQLRVACTGSVVAPDEQPRPVAECRKPAAELRLVTSVAVCSQTSWMDNRDIYKALESRPELQQWAVRVTPACDGADAVLDITHNLNLTVEWFWTLRAQAGGIISSGRVIAFEVPTAAQRIAEQVAHEIALAHGQELDVAEHVTRRASENVPIRNIRSHVLRSDFSSADSRISLSVDNETVTGRDAVGNVAFTFSLEDLLDVRRRKEWNHSLQLGEPTGLVSLLETGSTDEEVMAAAEGLAIYVSIGAVLAQVRTPVHILDLVWQENGAVKTVSLQVPPHESKRLLRALRPAGSSEQEQACSSATAVVAQPAGSR